MCVCVCVFLVWHDGAVASCVAVRWGDIQRARAWLSNKENPVDGKTAERG